MRPPTSVMSSTRSSTTSSRSIADYAKAEDGVEVAYDGHDSLEVGEPGFYHAPVIFAQKNDWKTSQEEIFGPVLSVIRFSTEDEVVEDGH